MRTHFVPAAAVSLALVSCLAACGGDSEPPGGEQPAVQGSPKIEGVFEVGDHELYLSCRGDGSPTVVYLHGYINDPSGGGSANAGEIPDLLADRHRICVYDRTNVGRSGSDAGPLTGNSSVEDLHDLLAAANVPGPCVLLGASFGGLIAQMYAASHPDDVVGMVLLDAILPYDIETDTRLAPKDQRLGPDDWKGATEKLDQLTSYRQALALEGQEPDVPTTYIATKRIELGPGWSVKRATAFIRNNQRAFVDRFSAGRLVIVDVPHYMEPVIPERIVREVERVVDAV